MCRSLNGKPMLGAFLIIKSRPFLFLQRPKNKKRNGLGGWELERIVCVSIISFPFRQLKETKNTHENCLVRLSPRRISSPHVFPCFVCVRDAHIYVTPSIGATLLMLAAMSLTRTAFSCLNVIYVRRGHFERVPYCGWPNSARQ